MAVNQMDIFDVIGRAEVKQHVKSSSEVAEKTGLSIPTLDDMKFEVNQLVEVVNPYDEDHEDYEYMNRYRSLEGRIIRRRITGRSHLKLYTLMMTEGEEVSFYENELK